MNYRQTTILAGTDVGVSGTKDIQIKVRDPISRITILWKVTKSKHGMDSYPHKDITKIELKDGSDVLFGMDGGQAQALNMFDHKIQQINHGFIYNGNSQVSVYGIDFGRFLHDPLLALDPKKFDNLYLYITYNEVVSDTGVSANELSVYGDVFDEKVINPIGFLMSKEHKSYTCGAENSYEYTNMPRDFPYRKMLLQGYRSAYEPWAQLKEARMDEDNDKRVLFDWTLEDYYRIMKAHWTPIVERISGGAVTTGQDFYVTPTDYAQAVAGLLGAAYNLSISGWQRGGKVTLYSETVDTSFAAIFFGFLPNHCFEMPFGDPQDIDDWYDVTRVGDLRLRLKAGSSGTNGTGAIVTQQLRRYQ